LGIAADRSKTNLATFEEFAAGKSSTFHVCDEERDAKMRVIEDRRPCILWILMATKRTFFCVDFPVDLRLQLAKFVFLVFLKLTGN
jgi:hypothetical protein